MRAGAGGNIDKDLVINGLCSEYIRKKTGANDIENSGAEICPQMCPRPLKQKKPKTLV